MTDCQNILSGTTEYKEGIHFRGINREGMTISRPDEGARGIQSDSLRQNT